MIVKVGVLILAVSIIIAVFTSNLFISDKEKIANREYIRRVTGGMEADLEQKYSHANIAIAKICRAGMAFGVFIITIGLIYQG